MRLLVIQPDSGTFTLNALTKCYIKQAVSLHALPSAGANNETHVI
jgi:hypothetical protein